MPRKRTSNRKVSISDFQAWRAKNKRKNKHIRESIVSRVGGEFLPTSLSKSTRTNIIYNLSNQPKSFIRKFNYLNQRYWIAELCSFEYNTENDRCYTYKQIELQKIDYMLKQNNIDKQLNVETKNPKRCKRMRIE